MSEWRTIRNASTDEIILARVKWCSSFWCRFRGLQFVRHLADDTGLLFVNAAESRSGTTIHMFFMFFSIGVVWINKQGQVVDTCLAKPWRPAYAPRVPAQYFIEARPSILDRVRVGDVLCFDEVIP
jgi:uncharacterized membrane protein (UPF0127 family)